MSEETHYEILGVSPNASKEKIRGAYQSALDASRTQQASQQGTKRPNQSVLSTARDQEARVRAAWQVLSDPYQRGRYDATLELTAHANAGPDEVSDESVEDDAEVAAADLDWRGRPRQSRRAQLDAARPPVLTDDGTQLELTGTGRRAAAAVIDIVVVMVLWGIALGIALASDYADSTVGLIQQTVMLGLFLLYFLLPVTMRGQSFGKRLTHTMLVDRATGHLPTPNKVLLHYLPTLAALFILGPQGGGPIAIMVGMSFLMTRDGMSLGDRIGKTAVVIARYRPERVR